MMDAPLEPRPPATPPPAEPPVGDFHSLLEQLLEADTIAPAEAAAPEGLDEDLWAHVLSSAEPAVEAPEAPAPDEETDLLGPALAELDAQLAGPASEPERAPEPVPLTSHVLFRLGRRACALPLAAVSEIGRPPRITRLPHVPAWILGIANLRGDIVSVLDLEGFFSGTLSRPSPEQRMVALRPAGDEVRTAVLVDSVDGIQPFDVARVAQVPDGIGADVAPYAQGLYEHDGQLFVVLDPERLLLAPPMRQFADPAGAP